MPASSSTLSQDGLGKCYDYQHNLVPHKDIGNPRYISATTGKCKRLKVQAMNGPFTEYRVPIKAHPYRASDLAKELVDLVSFWTHPLRFSQKFFLFQWYVIIDMLGRRKYTGHYKHFPNKYCGHFWHAKSKKEFSRHSVLVDPPLGVAHNPPATDLMPDPTLFVDITRARWPRELIIHGPIDIVPVTWQSSVDEVSMRTARYLAVSYKRGDFPADSEIYKNMIKAVRAACLEWHLDGYWLDNECTGGSMAKKNIDVYRIADVFRGAKKTLIMVHGKDGLQSWGRRVWTLPELLLSNDIYIQDTFDFDSKPRETDKRLVANAAYIGLDRETPGMDHVIDHFCGKDVMDRLERLSNLKDAIWNRDINDPPLYVAEKVYVLMGFLEHRILPNPRESEMNALSRLSMANDSDRIAERMLCMYPKKINDQACWYSPDDQYEANLWDIEPVLQVAGTTEHGALVLEGCRAASIRWKNFPRVVFKTKGGFRRTLCLRLSQFGLLLLLYFEILSVFSALLGFRIIPRVIIIPYCLVMASPWMFRYGTSGKIVAAQPWFIGVEGFMDVNEVVRHLYGNTRIGSDVVEHSPSGSPFSMYDTGPTRKGHTEKSQNASKKFLEDPNRPVDQRPYTLVDTLSNTIYHFTARNPPTVCVFGGREGSLGRFILCSEVCKNNELHKEAVLRMPTRIADSMDMCDWLAIGCNDGERGH